MRYLFCVSFLFAGWVSAQPLDQLIAQYTHDSWELYRELLSLPNDAHFPQDIERNVQWCEAAFGERGFQIQRLETPTVPLLLAEFSVPDPEKIILVYLQLDGQPVDPTAWFQPDPWTPVLKEETASGNWEIIPWDRMGGEWNPDWRIFARAASDAKGPVAMLLTAWDIMEAAGEQPSYSLKIIMDFEEELGSPHLPDAVHQYQEALAADALIIFDGPLHPSNQPTLKFGARGIATIALEVFGPRVPQHSGHFGNYAPNPAVRLTQLIASMKTDDGRVSIPGFYEGVELSAEMKAELAKVPDDEAAIRERLGIAQADGVGETYQEAIQYPSLNVRGLEAGWVRDEVRTIVPATAIAEIDVRLVKESDPERLIQLIRQHIESEGYHLLDRAPTDDERREHPKLASFTYEISYQAYRTPMDSPVGNWLARAVEKAHGKAPIRIRTSGGSIPISPFVVTLGIPAVSVPTVNMDNNQHSPNENLRLGNYQDGVKTMVAILREGW